MKVSVQAKNVVATIKDDEGNVVMDYSVEDYNMSLDMTKLFTEMTKLAGEVRRMVEDNAS